MPILVFLLGILTHGMETSFFRHYYQEPYKNKAFSTALSSILIITIPFLFFGVLFKNQIAHALSYSAHPEYILWFVLIISFDVLMALPLASLRAKQKPKRFAFIKVVNVCLLIGFNLFFLWLCPIVLKNEGEFCFTHSVDLYFRL